MSEHKNPNPYRRPIVVASTVLILGAAASLALNIKAISLTPDAEWGAYASGIGWPVALILAIELLIHTPWSKGKMDTWVKVGVLVLVAGVAAWISYWHGAHVLSHWGYDEVGRYAGPLVADAAMALATLALQRVAEAKRAAKLAMATVATPAPLATLATAPAVAKPATWPLATPLATLPIVPLATPAAVATEPANPLAALDEDWGNLEAELAAEGLAPAAEPEPAAAEPAQGPTTEAPQVQLTTVPTEAAKRIQAILAETPSATGEEIAQALLDDGLAGSTKTGRRWAAAVKNNTARVS